MNQKCFYAWLGLGVLIFSSGCASPRIISFDQTSVVVAVPEDSDEFPHYYKSEATKLAKTKIPDAEFVDVIPVKVSEVTQTSATEAPQNKDKAKPSTSSSTSEKVEYYLHYRSKATLSPLSTKPLNPVMPKSEGNNTTAPVTLSPIQIGENKDQKTPKRHTVPPITNPSPIQNNFPNTAMPR